MRGKFRKFRRIYSAIKVNGKKLYDYARQGQEVQIQPRKVTIEKIELKNFDKNNQTADILIKCSKGTYIRSIAHDLGQNLGSGGYLIKLIRTQAGKFLVGSSINLEEFDCMEKVEQNLINPLKMLDLPKVNITEEEHEKIIHGMPIDNQII